MRSRPRLVADARVEGTVENLVARTIRGLGANSSMVWLAIFFRYLLEALSGGGRFAPLDLVLQAVGRFGCPAPVVRVPVLGGMTFSPMLEGLVGPPGCCAYAPAIGFIRGKGLHARVLGPGRLLVQFPHRSRFS